ncbi:MAG: hypothetical protein ACLQFR_24175 [Streptosporangiaceae bacterium]
MRAPFSVYQVMTRTTNWPARTGGIVLSQLARPRHRPTFPGIGVHGAARYAVEALSDALRLELADSASRWY